MKVGHPILGTGRGAQLMAKSLGAVVRQGPFKEIGWYWINQTPLARTDPLFSNLDPYLLVFEWHKDTFERPSEAEGLAGNRAYPNQAFRLDSSSYGLQFHIEVTEPMIKTWLSILEDLKILFGESSPDKLFVFLIYYFLNFRTVLTDKQLKSLRHAGLRIR